VESAGKGITTAPKVPNPSLGYLASYARIAIHIGGISHSVAENGAAHAQ
jgi:hypothetical protein